MAIPVPLAHADGREVTEPPRGDMGPAVEPAIAATAGQPPIEVMEPALGRFSEPVVGVMEPPVDPLMRVMENVPGVMVPEVGPLTGTASGPPFGPGTGTVTAPSPAVMEPEVGPLIGAAGNHSTDPPTARLREPGLGVLLGSEGCKTRRAARLREPAAGALLGIPASGRLVMESALGVMAPALGLRVGTAAKPPTNSDAGNAPMVAIVETPLPHARSGSTKKLAPKVVQAFGARFVIGSPLAPLLGPAGQVAEAPRLPDMVAARTPKVLMTSSGDLPVASAAARAQSGMLASSPASNCITS